MAQQLNPTNLHMPGLADGFALKPRQFAATAGLGSAPALQPMQMKPLSLLNMQQKPVELKSGVAISSQPLDGIKGGRLSVNHLDPAASPILGPVGEASAPTQFGLQMPKISPVVGKDFTFNTTRNSNPCIGAPVGGMSLIQNKNSPLPDGRLLKLKQVKTKCGLLDVPVAVALNTFRTAAKSGGLTLDMFSSAFKELCKLLNMNCPDDDTIEEVFSFMDKDGNKVVDPLELCSGMCMFCQGSEDDKLYAIFNVFDIHGDGYITVEEMITFLTSVFKVIYTPAVADQMKNSGINVESSEELAKVTAQECFRCCDANNDQKLSQDEFKDWFTSCQGSDALGSSMRQLLE